jgi:hypothetical protein
VDLIGIEPMTSSMPWSTHSSLSVTYGSSWFLQTPIGTIGNASCSHPVPMPNNRRQPHRRADELAVYDVCFQSRVVIFNP